MLVGGGDESDFVRGRIGGKFLGKPLGKGAAAVIGEFVVGEREGLLRDDGLAAAITLGWVRRVEQLGKLTLAVWLRKTFEIKSAVAGFFSLGIWERSSKAERLVVNRMGVGSTPTDPASFHVGVVQTASTPASQADNTGSIPVTDTHHRARAIELGASSHRAHRIP